MSDSYSLLYPQMDNPDLTVSLYPGYTTGIDLRKYMDDILTKYGHYVMVRHYDKNTRSTYWNDDIQESIGGPPYAWDDYMVLSRKVIMRAGWPLGGLEQTMPAGLSTVAYVTYYLKWNWGYSSITNLDEICEFDWNYARIPGVEDIKNSITNKYNILESIDLLGDSGRREFYACICRLDTVGY